jgi:hypothetical protein
MPLGARGRAEAMPKRATVPTSAPRAPLGLLHGQDRAVRPGRSRRATLDDSGQWPSDHGHPSGRSREAWVSGDVFSDVTEHAVDLQGVAIGRALYEHVTARAAGRGSPVTARLCTPMEGELDPSSRRRGGDSR